MSNLKVFYHRNCVDGFTAAFIAYKHFLMRSNSGSVGPDLLPIGYGEPLPDLQGCTIYFLDFSPTRPQIIDLASRNNSVTILDHHETSEEALKDLHLLNVFITFDNERSGAMIAWNYFFRQGDKVAPVLVQYVQDRDLWQWRLPESRSVSAYIKTKTFDFSVWEDLNTEIALHLPAVVEKGNTILDYEKVVHDRAVASAFEVNMPISTEESVTIRAANSTALISEIAGTLAGGRPFGLCYYRLRDKRWSFSLRSRDGGLNVADIAKFYGGGGHEKAAGFEMDTFPAWLQ